MADKLTVNKTNNLVKSPVLERKTRSTAQKENSVCKAVPVKKTTVTSTKSQREPLKPLNATVKKNSVSPKKNVGPAKRTSVPSAKQPVTVKPARASVPAKKNVSTANSVKPVKKENPPKPVKKVNPPKIVVHQDEKTKKNTTAKSSGSTNPPVRKSVAPARKSLTTDGKTAGKKDSKIPAKPKASLTKFKPGKPEFEEMTMKLETMFINVDPEYVRSVFVKKKGSVPDAIAFLIQKEKDKEAPTKLDYLRRKQAETLRSRFMDNFSINTFVKMIPDPWEHFLKTERHNSINYVAHSFHYLKNQYKKHYIKTIQMALKKNNFSLYLANKELKKKNQPVKMRVTDRTKYECDLGKPSTFDIRFIHEVAFIENESKIRAFLKRAEADKSQKKVHAMISGTLLQCQSCCERSLLPDDAVKCPMNHVFCKDCVVQYVEVEMGKNNFKFKCLLKCKSSFTLESLEAVLSPPVMVDIIQRNREEEVNAASMDDLVYCPFCYTITIISPETTILKCKNPTCLMDTCRECKQLNHVPWQCHEIEKISKSVLEVTAENDQEEEEEEEEGGETKEKKEKGKGPIKCSTCEGDYVKQEDSKQLVCPCGSALCSICREPYLECEHVDLEVNKHRLSFSSDTTEMPDLEKIKEELEGNLNTSMSSVEF